MIETEIQDSGMPLNVFEIDRSNSHDRINLLRVSNTIQ